MSASPTTELIRLTALARCAGCASKMGPGDLSSALAALPVISDPRLLIGRETFDDAGIFRVSDDFALVQTVDFFPPIVDDPFDFGQIAAANALSDVYAMGGQPLTALNIVAFPTSDLPLEVLTGILAGGQDKVHEAGAVIVGGHTVVDPELKYGLAVTGRAHPNFLLTNAGARPGDQLVLTKPIGNGILATAGKRGQLSPESERAMLEAMKALNGPASRAALAVGSRCATDITGFGLLGHMSHVARASNVTLTVDLDAIPVFPGVREAVRARFVTDGAKRNAEYLRNLVSWKRGTDEDRAILHDPQTSGGLLVCVSQSRTADYLSRMAGSVVVGEVIERGEVAIEVH
ncbi:MAG TPA: selenide, water dikinase SelD [Gemmatimonadetes bacterium]|jgi:selenide,water dikinase|nr:selenide, water dikinase SelD [Gemmatimonadota bacterium]